MSKRKPKLERFWSHVDKQNDCWVWTAFCDRDGYGGFRLSKEEGCCKAHRFIWEQVYGPIPPGLEVLHSCDNPPCVKPTHLFLGTQQDNMLDMLLKGRQFSRHRGKTHCIHGHEFSEENTYRHKGKRACRVCLKTNQERWLAKKVTPYPIAV